MSRTQRQVSRRAIVVSGLTGLAAIAGVSRSRLPAAGPEPGTAGTPPTASPASTPVEEALDIAIQATGLRFSPAAITIPAHTPVRIVFTNRSRVYHDLVIPKLGQRTPRIGPDETSELLIRAEPGSYVFYCSIQSHHQAGMDGTITAR